MTRLTHVELRSCLFTLCVILQDRKRLVILVVVCGATAQCVPACTYCWEGEYVSGDCVLYPEAV